MDIEFMNFLGSLSGISAYNDALMYDQKSMSYKEKVLSDLNDNINAINKKLKK